MQLVIVGAGIFGVAAAAAAVRRGWSVQLVDPAPEPHPLAESTDISKAVRADYGPDQRYFDDMLAAMAGWRAWNAEWGEPLFHETGVVYVSRCPLAPGGFEYESLERLRRAGIPVERLDAAALARAFPAWRSGTYVDGYTHALGGWAESGRVVRRLGAGIPRVLGRAAGLLERGGRVGGVRLADGSAVAGDAVVLTTGAWITDLLPGLAGSFRAVGQPVFHLAPADPARFAAPNFRTFGADISQTGWYGFPLHPTAGVVKIANHGPGRPVHPGDEAARTLGPADDAALREFLATTFPDLLDAPVVHRRMCVYGDTWDEHFWIAPDPDRPGLVVAAGGSGHAFKFAPLLGGWILDALAGTVDPRFRWRPEVGPGRGEEAARARA